MRNNISISLALYATAIALLLLASPLVFFNLLPPVQAESSLSFRTTEPASGNDECVDPVSTLTFDVQGTPSASNPQGLDITSGTFKVTASNDEQKSYSVNIQHGSFTNNSGGGGVKNFALSGTVEHVSNTTSNCPTIESSSPFQIFAECSTSNDNNASNPVFITTYYDLPFNGGSTPVNNGNFNGVVECSSSSQGGGGNTSTTQQSSSPSMAAGSSQDSNSRDGDGDGIPDSSDRCTHNSNTRCFKEGGDTSTTTTTPQQEQPSSSNRTGNQTR